MQLMIAGTKISIGIGIGNRPGLTAVRIRCQHMYIQCIFTLGDLNVFLAQRLAGQGQSAAALASLILQLGAGTFVFNIFLHWTM